MGAVLRVNNWPTKLADFIESRRHEPFVWGENDCSLFVADAFLGISGIDYAEQFRGRYSTALGSLRCLKNDGFNSVSEYLTSIFGAQCQKLQLSRGDIGLYNSGNGDTLAICIGDKFVGTGENGLVFISYDLIFCGWKTWDKL